MNYIDRLATRIERAYATDAQDAADLDLKLLRARAAGAAELRSKARVLLADLEKEHGSHVSLWIAELAESVAADARAMTALDA